MTFVHSNDRCRSAYQAASGETIRCLGGADERTVHTGDHFGRSVGGLDYSWPNEVGLRFEAPSARQSQVGGSHYQRAIQVWDIVEVWELDFFRGSALKYLLRAGNKGPAVEDLKKARHYLDKIIEIEERGASAMGDDNDENIVLDEELNDETLEGDE